MLNEVLFGLVALSLFIYYQLSKHKYYWSIRGVPSTGFHFLSGNDIKLLLKKMSWHEKNKEDYFQFPGERFYGGWTMFGKPYLMLRNDFDLIKTVWIKDFDSFNTKNVGELADKVWPSSREERLAIDHILNAHGEGWKNLRSTFSPIFTSGKLKKMLPLLHEINNNLDHYIINNFKPNEEIDLKVLMGKFSMDAIASCAFGVDSGSFKDETSESEFVRNAKKFFEAFLGPISESQKVLASLTPAVIKQFMLKSGFKNFATWPNLKEHAFFQSVVASSILQRKRTKFTRNDLVDLMIDATEEKMRPPSDDKNQEARNGAEHTATELSGVKKKNIDYDNIISTAGVLLMAGYDTTGTTMSYILYELALNQDCQQTLFEEIETARNASDLGYDTLQSLSYLDVVIHETLRRHPVAATIERVCSKDYRLPNTNLILKKGDLIRLNNIGISSDPNVFPDPENWNPENFSKESRSQRSPYSFIGFSLGPRNCLAMRFAMFEMKVAVSHFVAKFKILPCDKTCRNVEVDPRSILGSAKGGLFVRLERR